METWIVLGAVVIAVLPRIPGVRKATKETIKGGIAVANKGKDTAVTAGEHWADLVAEAKADDPSSNGQDNNGQHQDASPDGEIKVPVTVDGQQTS